MKNPIRVVLFVLAMLLAMPPTWAYDKDKLYQIVSVKFPDKACLGQHKRHPEFPVVTRESRRNSRKPRGSPVIAR